MELTDNLNLSKNTKQIPVQLIEPPENSGGNSYQKYRRQVTIDSPF